MSQNNQTLPRSIRDFVALCIDKTNNLPEGQMKQSGLAMLKSLEKKPMSPEAFKHYERTVLAPISRQEFATLQEAQTLPFDFPKRFQGALEIDRQFTPWFARVHAECVQMTKNFANHRALGSNFLFSGKSFTGKTMMACAVGQAVQKQGYKVAYISALELEGMALEQGSEQALVASDLLILDNMFSVTIKPKFREKLEQWVYRRYENRLPTLTITEESLEQLSLLLKESLYRRLIHGGGIVHFSEAQMVVPMPANVRAANY